MANDEEWVFNVRRWVLDQGASTTGRKVEQPSLVSDASTEMLGYEAANPALQARHWPDADPV